MFERDYIMRLINEMVRALLKLLFHIDTESPYEELAEDANEKSTLNELRRMVDAGLINDAANKVYELTKSGEKPDLKIALLFYSYLNGKSDEFLEGHQFSRDEIKSDLTDLAERYGIDGFAEMFLQ